MKCSTGVNAGKIFMSLIQTDKFNIVYNKFLKAESDTWDSLDDYLSMLEYMSNEELYTEADLVYSKHKNKNLTCDQEHPGQECFVPVLVDVCGEIIGFYSYSGILEEKEKYILQYYIALDQARFIREV